MGLKSKALVQLALFDLPPSQWAAHIWRRQTRSAEHKRLLVKTTCSSPVKLRCLGVNVIAQAPVYFPLFHRHTCTRTHSTWPDPNPAGRFCNRITEASCCSLHGPKTHNWIEEFTLFPIFLFGLAVVVFLPSIVYKQAICPARAPQSVTTTTSYVRLQAVKSVAAGLKVLFLNWQGNVLLGHSPFLNQFVHPTFSSLCPAIFFWRIHACSQLANSRAAARDLCEVSLGNDRSSLWNGWKRSGSTLSSIGMAIPPAPHSGQPKPESLLRLTNFLRSVSTCSG